MSQQEIDACPDRWMQERRRAPVTRQWRVTASDLAAVLGLAPDSQAQAYSLWYEKMTGVSSFDGNERTEFGLYCENLTERRFADQHPELEIAPGGLYVSEAFPWLACTLDRIAFRDGCLAGTVQLKTAADRGSYGDPGSDVMPVHYRVQNLAEMIVTGAARAYMPVMFLPWSNVVTFVIERDAQAQADMGAILRAGEKFIYSLDCEEPPEPDWTPAATETLRRLYPVDKSVTVRIPARLAERRYRAAKARRDAEHRYKQAMNEILALAKNAGQVVAHDPLTGTVRTVITRGGGSRRGYSVPPSEFTETISAGDWGSVGKQGRVIPGE